jgi:RNA polymerase sigma-70 factor (ECF subfamily)
MGRYSDGDSRAFEALFERYERRAYAFFFKRTGSVERAQDLYQDLFLRVHRARHDYDRQRPFAPWLFQIAHRLLVDDVRRAYRHREVPLESSNLHSRASHGENALAERDELRRVLGALTVEERYVLVSAKVHGLGYAELAEQLGKSADAVKQLASRAMRRLRGVPRTSFARPVDL